MATRSILVSQGILRVVQDDKHTDVGCTSGTWPSSGADARDSCSTLEAESLLRLRADSSGLVGGLVVSARATLGDRLPGTVGDVGF